MRLSKLIAGLGLIVGAVGCHHTSGTCDCLPPVQPCALYGLYPGSGYNQAVPPATDVKPVEPVKTTAGLAGSITPAAPQEKEQIDSPKEQY
jgi:hypothetical protein